MSIPAPEQPASGSCCRLLAQGQRIDRAAFATMIDTRVLDRGVRGPLERI